ncbi:MAG TPA: hypothetical protein VFF33_14185 [Ignavibacteriaceae bacterium]|nr:hypothetical protein [Ignavibacteriaceae bacterium]
MKNIFIALLILFSSIGICQERTKKFSLSVNGVYTTSAKIYLNPNASDVLIRNNSFYMEDIFNPSIELRYNATEYLALGLNTEYIEKKSGGSSLTAFAGGSTIALDVVDGFRVIPIEFNIYYILPFSTSTFKLLMGGGAGYYIGEHIREVGDVTVSNVSRKIAYGIQVVISSEYFIKDYLSLNLDMKFRDPQFVVRSRYSKTSVADRGRFFRLPSEEFDSKINIDGVTFVLGAAFHF